MSKEEKQDASVETAPVHNDLAAEQLGQRHADDALLAELGYKSEFRREFSVRTFPSPLPAAHKYARRQTASS